MVKDPVTGRRLLPHEMRAPAKTGLTREAVSIAVHAGVVWIDFGQPCPICIVHIDHEHMLAGKIRTAP